MKSRRNWVWFFIKLFPLFLICVYFIGYYKIYHGTGAIGDFTSYILSLTDNIAPYFTFTSVSNPIISVFAEMLGYSGSSFRASFPLLCLIIRYCSYLVFVEILRIMYEVLVFLPKFANSFFERKLGD